MNEKKCEGISSVNLSHNPDLYPPDITSLFRRLTVEGDLDLRGTAITSLPEGLTVGGRIRLNDRTLTLPSGRPATEDCQRDPCRGE